MINFLLRTKVASIISLNTLIKLSGQNIIFPFYHAVSDKSIAHLKHLYSLKSEKEFIRDLELLLKHYKPIEPNELNNLKYLKTSREKYMLLTFDDGYRQVYDIILPILKKYSIPAIFFINSTFLDNKRLFYRNMVSIIVEYLKENSLDDSKFNLIRSILNRNGYLQSELINAIHEIEYIDKEILTIIAEILGIDLIAYLEKEKPYLTTGQLIEIMNQGYFIGSHSMDHAPFFQLDFYDQVIQVNESLRVLKSKFNLVDLYFSFPFTDYGVTKKLFERIQNDPEFSVNYTFGAAGLKKEKIINHFQRIPMEVSGYSALDILKAEYLYYLFKVPFNKNTIKRK